MILTRKERKELVRLFRVENFKVVKREYDDLISLYKKLRKIKDTKIKAILKESIALKRIEVTSHLFDMVKIYQSNPMINEKSIHQLLEALYSISRSLPGLATHLSRQCKAVLLKTTSLSFRENDFAEILKKAEEFRQEIQVYSHGDHYSIDIDERLSQLDYQKLIEYRKIVNVSHKDKDILYWLLTSLSVKEINELTTDELALYINTIEKDVFYSEIFGDLTNDSYEMKKQIIANLKYLSSGELEYLIEHSEIKKQKVVELREQINDGYYNTWFSLLPNQEDYSKLRKKLLFDNNKFSMLPSQQKYFLLESSKECDNKDIMLDYLIDSEWIMLFNSSELESIIEFLNEEEKEVLKEKIELLKHLEEQQKQEENTYIIKAKAIEYLSFLEQLTKDQPPKKKAKYIHVYSNLVQGGNIVVLLQKHSMNPKVDQLLKSTVKKKRTKQNLKFIKYIDLLDQKVQEEVLLRLINSQSIKNTKQIIEHVCNPIFLNLSSDEQLKKIENLPGDSKIIEEGINISIGDYSYFEKQISNHKQEQLIFKNKETGLQVKVKSLKNG